MAEIAGHTAMGTGLRRVLPLAFQNPQYRAFWLGMLVPLSLHDFHHKLPPTAGSRSHARPGNGILWDDPEHPPLVGMQVGTLASLITAPYTVALGGVAVAVFASGSAALSRQARNLGTLLRPAETGEDRPAAAQRGAIDPRALRRQPCNGPRADRQEGEA